MLDITSQLPLVGAGVTLASLVIAKESKVSDFRQAWIDALRADIALLVTSACQVQAGDSEAKVTLNVCAARTRLRFGYKDKQSLALQDKLSSVTTALYYNDSVDTLHDLCEEVMVEAQKVLKKEWTRVKWGEWTYRLLTILSFMTLCYLAWKIHSDVAKDWGQMLRRV